MGKRKKAARKVQPRRAKPVLSKRFDCLFCNAEQAIEIKMFVILLEKFFSGWGSEVGVVILFFIFTFIVFSYNTFILFLSSSFICHVHRNTKEMQAVLRCHNCPEEYTTEINGL